MDKRNENTEQQFREVLNECRSLFEKKLHDYSASWRILRPESLTDQLYIKAKRIRSIEIKKCYELRAYALVNLAALLYLYRAYSISLDV